MGAVLGQRLEKKMAAVCYVRKTLVEAQINYHDNRERAFGGGLRTREVLTLHLREKYRYLH